MGTKFDISDCIDLIIVHLYTINWSENMGQADIGLWPGWTDNAISDQAYRYGSFTFGFINVIFLHNMLLRWSKVSQHCDEV